MSPTIYREDGYRFFFFSREEPRPHVHVYSPEGEAKFWLEPAIALARHYRFSSVQLKKIENIIERHEDEFKQAWRTFFGD